MSEKKYQVAYLVRGKREVAEMAMSLSDASYNMKLLNRQGFTAWVETDDGKHFPVKGAMRPVTAEFLPCKDCGSAECDFALPKRVGSNPSLQTLAKEMAGDSAEHWSRDR